MKWGEKRKKEKEQEKEGKGRKIKVNKVISITSISSRCTFARIQE